MTQSFVQGDDIDIIQPAYDRSGTLIDLSDIQAATFKMKKKGAYDGTAYCSKTLGAGILVVADPDSETATSALQVSLTPADTGNEALPPGKYYAEFQITDSAGKKRTLRGYDRGDIMEITVDPDLDEA